MARKARRAEGKRKARGPGAPSAAVSRAKTRSAQADVRLPVTLLSGFLGAGKTSLLRNILKDAGKAGLKVAVLVNDMAELNIDARDVGALVQREEDIVKLQNGCICCDLRADLVEEVGKLARTGAFDVLVIESTGISEPMQVAETFAAEVPEIVRLANPTAAAALGKLSDVARLDTCVTVVDCGSFWADAFTHRTVQDMGGAPPPQGDERALSKLLVDQVEFADVVVLNKVDLVSRAALARVRAAVRALNGRCHITEATYANLALETVVHTGKYDAAAATGITGWMSGEAHEPESQTLGVTSWVYRRGRPFNSIRLMEWLTSRFVTTALRPVLYAREDADVGSLKGGSDASGSDTESGGEEEEDGAPEEDGASEEDGAPEQEGAPEEDGAPEQEGAPEEDGAREEAGAPEVQTRQAQVHMLADKWQSCYGKGRIFRSKGTVWLAEYHGVKVGWQQAGHDIQLGLAGTWAPNRGQGDRDLAPRAGEGDNEGEGGGGRGTQSTGWADWQTELVVIGKLLPRGQIEAELDECLLTDEEMRKGPVGWATMADPLEFLPLKIKLEMANLGKD